VRSGEFSCGETSLRHVRGTTTIGYVLRDSLSFPTSRLATTPLRQIGHARTGSYWLTHLGLEELVARFPSNSPAVNVSASPWRRCCAVAPILLLDEPFSALDVPFAKNCAASFAVYNERPASPP